MRPLALTGKARHRLVVAKRWRCESKGAYVLELRLHAVWCAVGRIDRLDAEDAEDGAWRSRQLTWLGDLWHVGNYPRLRNAKVALVASLVGR